MPEQPAVGVSYAQTAPVTCPACGHAFTFDIWLIVDAAERPDLLDRIRGGTLHNVTCPQCGEEIGQVAAPLLLYTPAGAGLPTVPPLLFSPAGNTTVEQDQEQAGQLVGMLRQSLAAAWEDAWLAEGLRSVPRAMLPALISGDPEAAREALTPQPPLPISGEGEAAEVGDEADALLSLIQAFINARTWNESRRIVEQNPALLTGDTDARLGELIEAQDNGNAVRVLEEHRALLRRCREAGIPRAFAEKTSGARGGAGLDVPAQLQPLLQELSRPARITDMPQRVQLCRQALTLARREENAALWAALQGELGNSLAQSPLGDRAQNLEEAIAAYRQALEVLTRQAMPVEWATVMMNLANAYKNRIRGDRAQNLEEAIAAYRQALEVFTADGLPDDCRRAARSLTNLYFAESRYADVIAPYRWAMRATENLLQASLVRSSKEVELGEIQGLSANAAYALAKLDRFEEAVEAIEAGRARLLAEALEGNRRDLERLTELDHGDLLRRYRQAAERIASLQQQASQPATSQSTNLPTYQSTIYQEIQAARGELDAAIAAIRQVPGYEDFFLLPDFNKICHAIRPSPRVGRGAGGEGLSLIYLLATPAGGLALLLRPSDQTSGVSVEPVWLDDLTGQAVRDHVQGPGHKWGGYLGAYFRWRRSHSTGTPPKERWKANRSWLRALDRYTRWLWDAVMGPVAAHMASAHTAEAVLIPTGLLALLPLHAAWTEDATWPTGRRYALDEVTFGYAASAVALARAREGAAATADGRLLAVDEPQPVSGNALPNSAAEVAAIASLFEKSQILQHGQATRTAVLDALPEAQVVHLSCHGATDWAEPLRSGVVMAGDEMLTVGDLLDRRLPPARLATLSACETGIVGTELPDEVVALPTALAQAGFAGVAASLWSVADVSTAMLMERFYRLWREDGLAPALALREAQRWLRDTTNREKADYFRRDIPTLSTGKMPEMIAADFFSRATMRRPADRDFAHPFWWAAFYLTGV